MAALTGSSELLEANLARFTQDWSNVGSRELYKRQTCLSLSLGEANCRHTASTKQIGAELQEQVRKQEEQRCEERKRSERE